MTNSFKNLNKTPFAWLMNISKSIKFLLILFAITQCGTNSEKTIRGVDIKRKFLKNHSGTYASLSGKAYTFSPNGEVTYTTSTPLSIQFSQLDETGFKLNFSETSESEKFPRTWLPNSYIQYFQKHEGNLSNTLSIQLACIVEKKFRLKEFLTIPKSQPNKALDWSFQSYDIEPRHLKYWAKMESLTPFQYKSHRWEHTYKTSIYNPAKSDPLPGLEEFDFSDKEALNLFVDRICQDQILKTQSTHLNHSSLGENSLFFHDFGKDGFQIFPPEWNSNSGISFLPMLYQNMNRRFYKIESFGTDLLNKSLLVRLPDFDLTNILSPLYQTSEERSVNRDWTEAIFLDFKNQTFIYKKELNPNSPLNGADFCPIELTFKIKEIRSPSKMIYPYQRDLIIVTDGSIHLNTPSDHCQGDSSLIHFVSYPDLFREISLKFEVNSSTGPQISTLNLSVNFIIYDSQAKSLKGFYSTGSLSPKRKESLNSSRETK